MELLEHPLTTIACIEYAAHNVIYGGSSDYQKINVRIVNFENVIQLRKLKASSIGNHYCIFS